MDDATLALFEISAAHPWSNTVRASVLNALQTSLQTHNTQKTQLRSIFADLDNSRSELVKFFECKNSLAELQAKYDQLATKQAAGSSDAQSKEQIIASLKVEVDKLRAMTSSLSTNAERFQSLFEHESKITTSLADLHRLLSYPQTAAADQIAADIKAIRNQANDRGDRMASLLAEQAASQEVIAELRRQLQTASASSGKPPKSPSSSSLREEEIAQLRATIDQQNQRLEQAAEYVKYQEEVISSLRADHKSPMNDGEDLAHSGREISDLKAMVASYETKLQQAAEFIKYQQEQLSAAEKHYSASTSNCSGGAEDLSAELQEAKALIASYEAKLQQAGEYVSYMQEQQAVLEEEIAQLKSQQTVAAAVKDYELKLEKERALVKELQSQRKAIDEDLQRLHDSEQAKSAELVQLSDRLSKETQEVTKLRQEVDKSKQEMDRAAQLHTKQADEMRRGYEQQLKEMQSKLGELHSLSDRLQASEEEVSSLTAVNHAYEEKLKKAAEYVAYLQSQYKDLEDELLQIRTTAPSSTSDNAAELKAQIVEYESKLQQGAEYVSYLQQQLNVAEERLLAMPTVDEEQVKASSSVKIIEKELASFRKEHENVLGQLKETQELNVTYENKLKQAAEYVSYLQEVQAEMQEQIQELQAQSQSGGAKVTPTASGASKQQEYEHQLQVNQSLRRQIDEMITRQEEMLHGIRDNEKTIADQRVIIAEQAQIIADLEAQQQQGIGIGKSKEEEVQSLRRQIIELKAAQAEALQDHEYIVKELVEMKVSYAQVREQFDTDKKTIARLKERIQAMQGGSGAADKRVAPAPSRTPTKKK
jgi:chromosome segregation ATPase